VSQQRYKPYGQARWISGTIPTDWRFTGQRSDEASIGLYDFRARYLDPRIGRFISADTIVPEPGDPQNLNRYTYVRNNPVKHIDPTGHDVGCPGRDASQCNSSNYVCPVGWGCFDRKHLTRAPNQGKGQLGFWTQFVAYANRRQDFSITLENRSDNGDYAVKYRVSGSMSSHQRSTTAMAIYQDYSIGMEQHQAVRSSFANADLVSNYLGLLSVIRGLPTPNDLIQSLNDDIVYASEETPKASFFSQSDSHANREFRPLVLQADGSWQHRDWPKELQVDISEAKGLWRREYERWSYGISGIDLLSGWILYDSQGRPVLSNSLPNHPIR
jgi:RHS repeat-associated protein